jgi:hypothetical protein
MRAKAHEGGQMAKDTSSRYWKIGTVVGLALICLAVLLSYLVWTGRIAGGKPICEVCKRVIHTETSFRIVRLDGSIRAVCCPRCGLAAVIQNGGQTLDAVDFTTRKRVRAAEAIYLEGTDIMECCTDTGFRSDEGAYQEMEHDRCMPSLLAFARREDAEMVRQKHDGNIISFDEARQSVVRQLKSQ